jgi:phage FluMu protein Com
MGKEKWVQCQQCGCLHKAKASDPSEDDLYITLRCPRCRDGTNHLLIGEHADDVYIYGNTILDARYYEYNTK